MSEIDRVTRTLHAYCRMLDERDLDRIPQVYLADATDDRKRGRPLEGHDQIRDYFQSSFAHVEQTVHILTNLDVDIDGSAATAYSRVTAYHWLVGGPPLRAADFVLLASYDDRLVRTEDGWRIAARVITALGPAGLAAGTLPTAFTGFGGKS